jgi:hypothetical protein
MQYTSLVRPDAPIVNDDTRRALREITAPRVFALLFILRQKI